MKEGIEGNTLVLTKLTRADGGAYLCIAQNGVPSPVSKRIMVHVHCKSSQIKHLENEIFTPYQFIQVCTPHRTLSAQSLVLGPRWSAK